MNETSVAKSKRRCKSGDIITIGHPIVEDVDDALIESREVNIKTKADFLLLPDVVVDKLFEFLGPKEQLTLRRTCQKTKEWTERYALYESFNKKVKKWEQYQFGINADSANNEDSTCKTIQEFIDSGLFNITSFRFKNNEIYNDRMFQEFVKDYGPRIRKLTFDTYIDCDSNLEKGFFESIINLKCLKICCYQIAVTNEGSYVPSRIVGLKNLIGLEIGSIKKIGDSERIPATHWIWNPLKYFPKLERLYCPSLLHPAVEFINNVAQILKADKGGIISLKMFYFYYIHFRDDEETRRQFREFLETCASKNIKQEYVGMGNCNNTPSDRSILSVQTDFITDVTTFIQTDLPNLERINCIFINNHFKRTDPDLNFRKIWSKLKWLRFYFKTVVGGVVKIEDTEWKKGVPVIEMVELLLHSEPRPSVESLEVLFSKAPCDTNLNGRMCVTSPRIIRAPLIVQNLPNLTYLYITGWDVDDLSFSTLWRGLIHLEHLTLRDCSTASDVAFIGEHSCQPSFSNLTKLKIFPLNLDNMPLVTDRFFQEVLLPMKLKKFALQSKSPLQNVTVQGIQSLLGGDFALSIESFGFNSWSLAGVNPDDFKTLRNSFRSIK